MIYLRYSIGGGGGAAGTLVSGGASLVFAALGAVSVYGLYKVYTSLRDASRGGTLSGTPASFIVNPW